MDPSLIDTPVLAPLWSGVFCLQVCIFNCRT